MRKPVAPVLYTKELSAMANMLRVIGVDKRLSPADFSRVVIAVTEITSVLSDAHTKPIVKE